jgi:PAS domain S-box-containing protein
LSFSLCAAAQDKPTRRILVLNEDGPLFPALDIIDHAIHDALNISPFRIEFYYEHMDTNFFPDPSDQQRFIDFYIRKYKNRRPDVIITVGPSPLKFMLERHQKAFPGVPVIFCLPNGVLPSNAVTDPDFTGVDSDIAPVETLEVALRLQPGTRHVIVVGGSDDYDKQTEAVLKQQLHGYEDRLDFVYLTDLAMPDLLESLRHPPVHSVILFTSMGRDAAGRFFIPGSESGPMIAAAANAPFFSLADVYLNHGEVGGDVSDLAKQGKIAAEMALRILNGEKPQNIPRSKGVMTYMFDWKALKRWGINEKSLPVGSIVLNRAPTLWESYKWYIVGGISLILIEALLIGGLVWQRVRRRKAEAEVATALGVAQESEKRFRLVANTAPVLIWMSGPDKLCIYLNQPWLEFTGRPLEEQLGNGWAEGVHPEDLKACLQTYSTSFDQRQPFEMEYRLKRNDGEYRWIFDIGVPRFNSDRSLAGYIGSCIDVTDRKLAAEALSNVSRRLIEAQEQERMRIARELHDDINQRIAMLSIDLDRVQQNMSASDRETSAQIKGLQRRLLDIGLEVQTISHRLHSSKLEYLGLVVACRSFCHEVGERHQVKIDFVAEDVPRGLPQDVSLCLFRVLQESLNNAIKYSGVQQFEVQLRCTSDELQLTVRDRGMGFDVEAAMSSQGLGLISMRERASSVKGTMLITSKPMGGTEITVHVPMVSAERAGEVTSGAA